MRIKLGHTLASGLFFVLSACSGGDASNSAPPTSTAITPAANLQALQVAGDIPTLDRSASISGSDANNNGVRDDVDAFITRSYPAPGQQAAALQYAKGIQLAITIDKSNSQAVKSVDQKESRAIKCIFSRFRGANDIHPSAVVSEIEAITSNTKDRLKAYLAYSKAMDGTTSAIPDGDTCE